MGMRKVLLACGILSSLPYVGQGSITASGA